MSFWTLNFFWGKWLFWGKCHGKCDIITRFFIYTFPRLKHWLIDYMLMIQILISFTASLNIHSDVHSRLFCDVTSKTEELFGTKKDRDSSRDTPVYEKVAHCRFFWVLLCLQFHSSDLHDSHKLHILIQNGKFHRKATSLQVCYKMIVVANISRQGGDLLLAEGTQVFISSGKNLALRPDWSQKNDPTCIYIYMSQNKLNLSFLFTQIMLFSFYITLVFTFFN